MPESDRAERKDQFDAINKRLDHIDQRIESYRQQMEAVNESLHEVRVLLTGNGTPERGHIVRMDRMEQKFKSMATIGLLVAGALASGLAIVGVGLIVKFIGVAHKVAN